MSQIVVKTNNKKVFNQSCCYPGVGDVHVDENGEFSVPDTDQSRENIATLIKGHAHFFIKGEEEGQKPTETPPVDELNKNEINELSETLINEIQEQKEENPLNEETGTELSPEDKQNYITSLQDKTRKQLEDECKTFPSAEWRGKTKELLIAYLVEKLG